MSDSPAIVDAVRERILAGLHFGTLHDGDRLPSVRRLGAELHVDPRSILAAYHCLVGEGLVRLRTRSGVFVSAPQAFGEELPEAASWILDAFLEGFSRGIPPTELRRLLLAALGGKRFRAACLECNDDQLEALCRQVRDEFDFQATPVDLDATARGEALPARMEEADLILTTPFHAGEARQLGTRLRRPVVVATLDPTFISTVSRLAAEGPLWWVCTDPRYAAKLSRMHPGVRMHAVVHGRDALENVPPDAIVCVTPRAAERLPLRWRAGRVVTPGRMFSSETARALVAFRLCRNLERGAQAPPARQRAVGYRG